MAAMFRQSMLLSSILCNSEVLYGLNSSHIDTLESVDKLFWKKVLQCPVTTPTEVIMLETDSMPIRHIIQSRRLMYYWEILQRDDSELLKRFFKGQEISPCKNDWVLQIKQDLEECKITLSESEIRQMSEYSFRKLVRESVKELSVNYLLSLKVKNNQEKSKSKNIWPSNGLRKYLISNRLSTEEKRLLFAMRCRVNEVKNNYKTKYKNNMKCMICSSSVDESEIHLLQCDGIINEADIKSEISKIEYSDIFSDLEKQITAIKVWRKIFKIRDWKNENRKLSSTGHQAHQLSASYAQLDSSVAVDDTSPDGDTSTIMQNMLFDVYEFGY